MVTVIVQARTGSSRLPGKVLKEVAGRSLIAHCLARCARAKRVDAVWVATTDRASDDALARAVEALGFRVFRGSEHDVLARYHGAAEAAGGEVIVRVTGDCPLIDPVEVDRVIDFFLANDLDYAANLDRTHRSAPVGLDVEVFSRAALERAHDEARAPGEREHVTPYLYGHPELFRVARTDSPIGRGDARLTVDTPADLEVVDAVVAALGPGATTAEILTWLDDHPEVAAKNAAVEHRGTASEGERRAALVKGELLVARVDAGPKMGFGHLARAESLLDAWTELGGRALLLGEGIEPPFSTRLAAAGVEVRAGAAGADEVAAGARAILIDGYHFPADLYAALAGRAPVIVVDDDGRAGVRADLTVHPYPGPGPTDVRFGRVLAGLEYALLRRELRAPVDEGARSRVLVSFGGSDPAGLSPRALGALAGMNEIDLVVGPGFSAELRAELEAAAGQGVEVHEAPPSLRALADRAAVAVVAAGSTVWELLARGVVPVAIPVADNQAVVVDTLRKTGAGVALDADASAAEIRAAVDALLSDPARLRERQREGRALIDGRGVWRVIDALLEMRAPSEGETE